MPITFEQLWSEKYAALFAAAAEEEESRRAEDFFDVPRTVCGLPLRAMTPRDLLALDYVKSPFVCGGEIEAAHIAQFLWQLHANQPRSWWGTRRFFKHCGALEYTPAVAAISAYVARILADQPRARRGEGGRPLGTSFIAPLVVRLATGIPALTPAAIMDTPLPQLFQYQKILAAEAAVRDGRSFRDYSDKDRLLAECLDECNRLNAAAPAES